MDADGRYGKHASWDADATPIKAVVASWHSGVVVKLPWQGSAHATLDIEARCDFQDRHFEVRIRGGNTNDGDAARYEQAIRDYSRAVEIARLLESALEPDFFYFAPEESSDIVRGIMYGYPDYVLALYLMTTSDGRFAYMRDGAAFPPVENRDWPVLDLGQLRERAVLLAQDASSRVA
jgi:hypothetical protein